MKTPRVPTFKELVVVLLVVPITAAAIFYAFIAQDRYVSRTAISVRDISGLATSGSVSSLIGASAGVGAVLDLMSLQSYLRSADMLARLDKKLNLRAHYASPKFDRIYALAADAPSESFLKYFNSRLEITFDDISGILIIDVQAFDRDTAHAVSSALLVEAERFLNEYMHRIARERMDFAQQEIDATLKRLQASKAELLQFQVKNKLLDPVSQASANSALTANLQATLASQEASLNAALGYLSEDSYQVKSLRGQLAATRSQLDAEKLRATASSGGTHLAELTIQYQALLSKATFAEENYRASLVTLEAARADSLRKMKTLVVLEPPTVPDLALYPRRLYDFLTCAVGLLMLFTIVRLIVATIREHQD